MTSPAQIHANQINTLASSGPRSPEAKARVARNSVTRGLFAAHDIVRPEEQAEYDELRAALEAELLPETTMERTHAKEILHATWRLRRCAVVEGNLTQLQTERYLRTQLAPETPENLMSHQTETKTLAHDTRRRLNLRKLEDLDTFEKIFTRASEKINTPITRQSQFADSTDPPQSPTTPSPANSPPSRAAPASDL